MIFNDNFYHFEHFTSKLESQPLNIKFELVILLVRVSEWS